MHTRSTSASISSRRHSSSTGPRDCSPHSGGRLPPGISTYLKPGRRPNPHLSARYRGQSVGTIARPAQCLASGLSSETGGPPNQVVLPPSAPPRVTKPAVCKQATWPTAVESRLDAITSRSACWTRTYLWQDELHSLRQTISWATRVNPLKRFVDRLHNDSMFTKNGPLRTRIPPGSSLKKTAGSYQFKV